LALVYFYRIDRAGEDYLSGKLGAFASKLSCLGHFFEKKWSHPYSELDSHTQIALMASTAFVLRALGRIEKALELNEKVLHQHIKANRWDQAAGAAINLSEYCEVLGLLRDKTWAQKSIEFADRSGNEFLRMASRSRLARIKHQQGEREEAKILYEEAERMQMEREPHHPILYSLQGYNYCDLLLEEGNTEEVIRRAGQTIKWGTNVGYLLDIGLGFVSLGLAKLVLDPMDLKPAGVHMREAVVNLRAANSIDRLPLGFLAQAAYHRKSKEYNKAERELEKVEKIVRRTGMFLYNVEVMLERAKLHLVKGNQSNARATLKETKELVQKMGYNRRLREIKELEEMC